MLVPERRTYLVFEPEGRLFSPLVMAEFGNQTVVGFWLVQEHALRHKAGRTACKVEGLSHHEWCFLLFLFLSEGHHKSVRFLSPESVSVALQCEVRSV
jgi:hypothetical protein